MKMTYTLRRRGKYGERYLTFGKPGYSGMQIGYIWGKRNKIGATILWCNEIENFTSVSDAKFWIETRFEGEVLGDCS